MLRQAKYWLLLAIAVCNGTADLYRLEQCNYPLFCLEMFELLLGITNISFQPL